jgi:hypothetical protein
MSIHLILLNAEGRYVSKHSKTRNKERGMKSRKWGEREGVITRGIGYRPLNLVKISGVRRAREIKSRIAF